MIRRTPLAIGATRDAAGRLVLLAPRRHRALIALCVAAMLAAAGFLIGQRVLGHAAAAVPAGSPTGHVDSIVAVPGGFRLAGWSFDPSAKTTAVQVEAFSDGRLLGRNTANVPRADIARIFAGYGPDHGYSFRVLAPEGRHSICITALNIGAGANRTLGCQTLTLRDSPIGHVDALMTTPGHLVVAGWTFDPDSPTTVLSTYVSIDGTRTSLTAGGSRPDIATAFPGAGAAHGFSTTMPMPEGTHTVCVVAVNVSYGADTTLRCASLTLIDSPTGSLDAATQVPGGFRISGWVYDPNALTTALTMNLTVDGTSSTLTADGVRQDVANAHPSLGADHGYAMTLSLSQGSHSICLTAVNIGYGSDTKIFCRTITLNFNPTAAITDLRATADGASVSGWTTDPDTADPIHALITVDKSAPVDVVASGSGTVNSGHDFARTFVLPSGQHTICVVGVNVDFGTGNSPAACGTINLALNPFGHFDAVGRASATSTALRVSGWAIDPDTSGPVTVAVSVDGTTTNTTANVTRNDVGAIYPFGAAHGFDVTIAASDWEHKVCVTALNIGGGTANTSLGCRIIDAVHPVVPAAPTAVAAVAGFGGAIVNWKSPTSDGGAPWSSYTITASPGGVSTTASASATSTTITGLADKTTYTFAVVATNVVGNSHAGVSAAVTTLPAPPPQTTPAPISTSRYIRNIHGSSSGDLSAMHSEGAADATANPSGHGYLILLDIGGQDQADGGVVLSATTRFIGYSDLVQDVNAYVDGYHSAQKSSAPVTIALGTNNDMDVSSTTGATWAATVVNAVAAHAAHYLGMSIAGANDIEPGFRATFAQTQAWLTGYLGATKAAFVFNGSADGCSWTQPNDACNNGWNMAGLYNLAAGASPIRIVNLPQIYNTTMAAQWRYISMTGVDAKAPRIDFGGALTEWTACAQTKSCGSLTGNSAWQALWNDLQSEPALKVNSLPYSTDLRIDS